MVIPHRKLSIDINRPNQYTVDFIAHVGDKNTRYIDITFNADGEPIELEQGCAATVTYVSDGVLIEQAAECDVDGSTVIVGIDTGKVENLRSGILEIQPKIVDGSGNIIVSQIPVLVRISPDIAEHGQIKDDSLGTYAEVVREISEARGTYANLKERLDHTGAEKFVEVTDTSDTVVDNCTDPDTVYIVKVVSGVVTTTKMRVICTPNVAGQMAQYAMTKDGYIISRKFTASKWGAWDFIPDSKRVAAMILAAITGKADKANSLSGYGITNAYNKIEVDYALAHKADKSTTLAGYGITDAYTKSEVDELITDETKLLADGCGVIPSEMVHGSGSSQNGSVVSPYNYRVTSKDIVSFDRDVTLKSKTGFVFNLYFFTAQGAYDRFVQNQTSYSLANNKKVRITIKRSTEDTSEVADIPLFASSVYYEGEPLQRINNIDAKLDNFVVDEEYTDFSDGYISTNTTPVNLTPTPSSSYKCVVVDCSEGDAFQVTGSGSVSNTVFAFLNSSDTVITKPSADISIHDLELVAPANTAKAVFNFRTSYDIKLVKNPASYIADKTNRNNEARIENAAFCFSNDDNLIENTKMVGGFLRTESGNVDASATYYTTDYIFVPKDKTIRFEPRIRKFLAYDYPSAPIAGSFVDLTTQGAYEYTATHDCYVRVTIAKEYVGITQAKILPFIVDSAVIGANDLIEFATIQNIKKCTFSKSGRELTVATSENDTYCCVDILTNAFEADNLYYFDIDIKTATGSGKALRVLFLGTESNQNNTYSGVRTDHVSAGDKIKVFACAKKGCRGIRLFITGGTSGDATFVFNHLSIYKVLKINEPEKKKERRFMQPKARVSIMDDDGYVTFYQYLLPMIRTYGIPIATAYQGDNGYELRDQLMTREQLHEVEEAGGEIIAHGYNSLINLGSEAEADIILSKKMLNASGFFPTVYVYPYGDNNQNIRQLVEKYFDCSFKVATPYPPDYRTEAGCVPMFRLNRCHCGGENYDVPVTTGRYANLDTASMDYFEALIQECIARKSWLVLYTHSWQMEEGQQPTGYDNQFDLMEAIIKRILELKESGTDIDIIKFEDGIEMFGNAFQAGDYLGQSNNDLTLHTNPGCAISKQGLYDFPAGNNMTPST